MKITVLFSILTISMATAAFGQTPPPGADVSTAIPIFYGQFVNGIGDKDSNPLVIYSISLAKGQQFSAALTVPATAASPAMQVILFPPTVKTLASVRYNSGPGNVIYDTGGRSATFTYLVPADGTYYIAVVFGSESVSYTLQVSTTGTPQLQALPPQAGCLTGLVDYITYSLDLIALDLPDTVSIGGTQACSGCAVQAPLYSQIVQKLEKALTAGLTVQACYDGGGNIFQVTLQNPNGVSASSRSKR